LIKILHLPNSFFPKHTGGKEVYTLRFAQSLKKLGTDNVVFIHNENDEHDSYEYEGIKVVCAPRINHNFPYSSRYTRTASYIPLFEKFLDEYKPDIVHFHDQNDGASLSHLEIVKSKNIKAVVTFHTPGQVCPQHALLQNGKAICNGILNEFHCTSCQLQSFFNMPSWIANLSSLSKLKVNEPTNRLSKLLAHRNMTQKFIQSYYRFADLFDKIIVFSNWGKETFLINNISENKIAIIDTGGKQSIDFFYKNDKDGPIELCFIGRCEEIKGIHLLIQAVKEIDNKTPLKVYFYSGNWEKSAYGQHLLEMISDDDRFNKPIQVENHKLHDIIKYHDICVIPSIWPETGPLTVFDAFAAGLPIIGSNSAGIADRVNDGVNGLLFKTNSHEDLKLKIFRIINNRDLINNLKKNILSNRTMDDVAKETLSLYNYILNNA
jgi:glycosyltransferase involved in cell wall biosynthesis